MASISKTRPEKRRRTDCKTPEHAGGSGLIKLKRDDQFWLDDGNLILVAGYIKFRVYRGLLAAQSAVLRDMFPSSHSPGGQILDGCPVVYLSDSPEHVRHLLDVLLPARSRRFYRDDQGPFVNFDQLVAVIGLAHKYDIADLERQALSALKERYCSTFEAFEEGSSPLVVEHIDAIPAVNLARLTDTPSILPLALYRCCSLGSSLLDGWTGEDGRTEYLAPEDLRRCIDGRDAPLAGSVIYYPL